MRALLSLLFACAILTNLHINAMDVGGAAAAAAAGDAPRTLAQE